MKLKCILGASLMLLICSCSNDLSDISSYQHQNCLKSRSAEQMLNFANEEEFQLAVNELSKLSSWDEKLNWMESNYGEFQSMQTWYDQALWEAESVGESEDDYNQFKEKYASLYFPMYQDDYGFYIPMKNLDEAFLVNSSGNVCIGGQVVNKKDLNSYDELMELDRAYYTINHPQTLAVSDYETGIFKSDVENEGSTYDSGWKVRDDGKRKLKLKTRRRIVNWNLYLHTEICFRKKTWRGWVNYKSKTSLSGNATIYVSEIDDRKSNMVINTECSESGRSSHDTDFSIPVCETYLNGKYIYYIPRMVGNAVVDYQGMGKVSFNNWNLKTVKIESNTSVSNVLKTPIIK